MAHGHHRESRGRAFTLVEAAISTVIVGVMAAAALSVVGGAARGAAREREWRQGQSLAAALMAEIMAASYSDPQGGSTFGLDTGETAGQRSTFDDVDDFDGYVDSPPTDAAAKKIAWAVDLTRRVTVENVMIDNPSKVESNSTDTGLRRITVMVTSPGKQTRTMTALKSRDTVVDAAPAALGVDRVTGVRISLQAGRCGTTLVGGATLFNTPLTTLAAKPEAAKAVAVEAAKVEVVGGK